MSMADYLDDTARSVAFLSRIHVPQRHFVDYDGKLSRALRAFPVAGILIALPAAALVSVFQAVGAEPLFTAFVALGVLALITGALHEDGLADTADGIGGGRDKEHALTIMRDSRIGTYGAVALVLSFGIRTAALAAILPQLTPSATGLVFLAVAALSRAGLVWHWSGLPPARKDGVAAMAGTPDRDAVRIALVSAGILGIALFLLAGLPLLAILLVLLAFAGSVPAFGAVVGGKIGGHTGDTLGAAQQLAEMAILIALALAT